MKIITNTLEFYITIKNIVFTGYNNKNDIFKLYSKFRINETLSFSFGSVLKIYNIENKYFYQKCWVKSKKSLENIIYVIKCNLINYICPLMKKIYKEK